MDDKNSKIYKHRRLKYGSMAVALTAVCVALVIVLNAIVTGLTDKYRWYIDMTEEQLYSLSDTSTSILDEYQGLENFNIEIIFCMTKDRIEGNYYMNLIYSVARLFEEKYDYISIDFKDIKTHPSSVEQYRTNNNTKISEKSIIVTNGSESRLFNYENFFVYDSDTGNVFALNAEYKLTSSIVQMDGNHPIAYFVEGHGEVTEKSAMFDLFEDAGFDVRTIDLTKEDFDPEAAVCVINNPIYDYMGADATVNEIAKIDNFLDKRGNLMIFMDGSDRDYPELDELMSEWGIKFENAVIKDFQHSLSVDGTELVADYETEGTGASLTTDLRELTTRPKMIVNYARPVSLLFENHNGRETSAILKSSAERTAEAYFYDSEEAKNDIFNLMVLSTETTVVDNEYCYNYVLAAGTSSFADDKYIDSNSYGNRDIIFAAMKTFVKKTVPMDIDFKVFEDEGLDITMAEAYRWTAVYTLFLPVVVFAVAAVVFIRRKHQ